MRTIFTATLALFVCFALLGAPAVAAQRNPNPDINHQELLNFDRFLDNHPNIEQDLRSNPKLINDSNYVNGHPELKEFLGTHPGVREEIRETPRYFMQREQRFDKSGRDITRPEVARFDEFLDSHPAVDKDLSKHPEWIRNPDYLAKHPELRSYLDTHPQIRQEASENPKAFMKRERKFDKQEGKKVERREERRARKPS